MDIFDELLNPSRTDTKYVSKVPYYLFCRRISFLLESRFSYLSLSCIEYFHNNQALDVVLELHIVIKSDYQMRPDMLGRSTASSGNENMESLKRRVQRLLKALKIRKLKPEINSRKECSKTFPAFDRLFAVSLLSILTPPQIYSSLR